MTRSSNTTRSLLAALLLLGAGCDDKASDMQEEADAAQNAANAEISDVKVDARQEVRAIQANADKDIATAEADFSAMREEYRHATTLKMVDLEKSIADLEARASKATGTARSTLETHITGIHTAHKVFMDDYATLDQASGATWDTTKARLDREWDDLKALVDKA